MARQNICVALSVKPGIIFLPYRLLSGRFLVSFLLSGTIRSWQPLRPVCKAGLPECLPE